MDGPPGHLVLLCSRRLLLFNFLSVFLRVFRGRIVFSISVFQFFSFSALAHIGSPDVFYDGAVGPYQAHVTIRMPNVVPGRAQIDVRLQASEPVNISFLPLYAHTASTNAPPADPAQPVAGETNFYSGELWLMSFGAYSIEVRIRGHSGEGMVQIPVNSVAIRQLPLPSFLGKLLLALGAVLFCGGIAIVAGAARDSTLMPGASPGTREKRKGLIAAGVTCALFVCILVGGKKWWSVEEADFRRNLREGAWPDLEPQVQADNGQRVLRLTVGEKEWGPNFPIRLTPDHGKLIHLFLVREPELNAFAHLHPLRKGNKTFEVPLPPLPEGTYRLFCDLTFEDSGLSSTATNSVQVPALSAASDSAILQPDPDDSWASYNPDTVAAAGAATRVFRFPDGRQVVWKAGPLRARHDASLRFEVRDAAGQLVQLEPYMGMICHAAVLRKDGGVFAHLHPSGNFSMAAQQMFEEKLAREQGRVNEMNASMTGMMEHNGMQHMTHSVPGIFSLPYEFPAPGNYRIWVQFKSGGVVSTAVFDATVSGT